MKIGLNTYQIIMLIFVSANIIGGLILGLFLKWIRSEMKSNNLKIKGGMDLLNEKVKTEIEIRKDDCHRYEKTFNRLFDKIDKVTTNINDRFINAVAKLEG